MKQAGWLWVVLLGASSAFAQQAQPADLILINGKVWTAEESQPLAEAVAIRGNRIVAVGSLDEINKLSRFGRTRVLDVQGRLILPGFIDNHTHFTQAGRLLLGLNLLDVNDAAKLRERVADGAKRLPAGAWLRGRGWQLPVFPEGPRREDLDAIAGDRPALIVASDGHSVWVNTAALTLAGVTRDTPDPPDGRIERV